MTTEEKAKAWDEAIERAKSKIRNDKDHVLYEEDILDIFPSLKESDEERIRKYILSHFQEHLNKTREFISAGMTAPFSSEEIKMLEASVAWLEKQGEKGTNGNEREFPFSEKKPAWSEEDEKMCTKTIFALAGFMGNEDKIDWLKSLKDRYTWKPSEQDILLLERIANGKSNPQDFQASLGVLIEQLKKLKGE